MFGFIAQHENGTRWNEFDPFDNDYIEVFTTYWNWERSFSQGLPGTYLHPGPELEICSLERKIRLFGANLAPFY